MRPPFILMNTLIFLWSSTPSTICLRKECYKFTKDSSLVYGSLTLSISLKIGSFEELNQYAIFANFGLSKPNKLYKDNTSGFLKKVKLKKYKVPFFKNGALNDVIERFFFQKRKKKCS